jgi:hypothetical protein
MYSDSAALDADISPACAGRFTLTSTATIELQYRVGTTRATNGLGSGLAFGEDLVHSNMRIWKLDATGGGAGGSSSVTTEFAAAIFDGTDASIDASTGISSIVRDSTGLYTITFNTAQPDTNYFIEGFAASALRGNVMFVLANKTTNSCQIRTSEVSTGTANDLAEVHVKFSRIGSGSGTATEIGTWAAFDSATGALSIYDSKNITSITDTGTGNYTLNLTNALASTNVAVMCSSTQGVSHRREMGVSDGGTFTTSAIQLECIDQGANVVVDVVRASVAIIGG